MSPTQRTLKHLRAQGYVAAVVERFNPYVRIRQDLFGCIDILAVGAGCQGVLAVQTTTTANMYARIEKCRANPVFPIWKEAGNRFIVHGWAKRGGRGARKLWTLKEAEL
jgi:hypothetical protein